MLRLKIGLLEGEAERNSLIGAYVSLQIEDNLKQIIDNLDDNDISSRIEN